jgi:AhpD family alkylhydroperoxidase
MTNREFADIDLRCASCGDGFVLSAGEQELFRLRGITAQPERCPSCVRHHSQVAMRTTAGDRSIA